MDLLQFIHHAIQNSEIIPKISLVKEKKSGRKLTALEIDKLKANGNISSDWDKITVADKFLPDNIYHNYFSGNVYLGEFSAELSLGKSIMWRAGIYNSTIINSILCDQILIKDVHLLANYYVSPGAMLLHTKSISHIESATHAIGEELIIANEAGGREVPIFPELTIKFAEHIATQRDAVTMKEIRHQLDEYLHQVQAAHGYIGKGATIKNSVSLRNTFIGDGALIENVNLLDNSLILSEADEKTTVANGAVVRHSILQWGSQVDSMAIIDHCFLCEHSRAARHAKITQSIIGPNTGIAEGEVTSCLCGPFIGFHHQALLIAAFWPEGKGNVSYGANVGSNHTAKAPDQEIWPGEGVFFGLGVNIKFPSNFREAPYSIIATNVCTLPQKVSFPFSVINTPSRIYEGIPHAYNELMPGWILANNIFMIRRNEGKYAERDKAKRNKINYQVFRKDIIELMIRARNRLKVDEIKPVYTEKEVPGLGKNFMTEGNRLKGVEAYNFFIKFYALKTLKDKCQQLAAANKLIDEIPVDDQDQIYTYARSILSAELPGVSLHDCLLLLSQMQEQIARNVELSKHKDDVRGRKIIDDYDKIYPPAEENYFVLQTWKETRTLQKEIGTLLEKLKAEHQQ